MEFLSTLSAQSADSFNCGGRNTHLPPSLDCQKFARTHFFTSAQSDLCVSFVPNRKCERSALTVALREQSCLEFIEGTQGSVRIGRSAPTLLS